MDWVGVPGKSRHNELAVVGCRLVGAFTPPFPPTFEQCLPPQVCRLAVQHETLHVWQWDLFTSFNNELDVATMLWLLRWLVYIYSISVLRYCVGGIEALERLSIVVVVTERHRIWRDWRWRLRRRRCGRVWVSLLWRTVSCISLGGKTQLMFVWWYYILLYERHLLLWNACLI